MKIAIVINNSFYAWNMRANLGFAFKKVGYEVIFIAPYDEKYSNKLKEFFEYYDIYINSKGINPIEDMKTLILFYKIYQKIQPDLICHYNIKPNIYGTVVASLLQIPVINNIAGLGTLFMNQNQSFLKNVITNIVKLMYKYSQKRASKIFFQNRDDFNMFLADKIVDKDKCDILPGSGVDLERFKPVKKKDDGIFRFLLISRMLRAKGVVEYVKAANIIRQKYDNVEFQLLGALDEDSPTAISKDDMDIWVEEGSVIYLGKSDDVRIELAQVDCIVLPSYYREGTPRSLLEAAAMAKPIITTDNIGCRDVVEDGINGFLCKVRDSKDLAEKMEMMINLSEEKRIAMGKAGREKMIREFDEKIVINKYIKSIEKILT